MWVYLVSAVLRSSSSDLQGVALWCVPLLVISCYHRSFHLSRTFSSFFQISFQWFWLAFPLAVVDSIAPLCSFVNTFFKKTFVAYFLWFYLVFKQLYELYSLLFIFYLLTTDPCVSFVQFAQCTPEKDKKASTVPCVSLSISHGRPQVVDTLAL